jgi:hypothetical protein
MAVSQGSSVEVLVLLTARVLEHSMWNAQDNDTDGALQIRAVPWES